MPRTVRNHQSFEVSGLSQVLAQLEEQGTAQNRKIYGRHGAAEPMFGVSYAVLNKIAKEIKTDHELAEQLWDSGNHDARVLALKVADPSSMTVPQARCWLEGVDNYILAEALGGFCARTPHARALSDSWRDVPAEWPASVGWSIVACTAEDADVWSLPELYDLLSRIEAEIARRPNRVRHEMNGAMIVMALRDTELRSAVLAAAERIGPVQVDHGQTGCKTPEVSDYVQRTLAHRARRAERAETAS
ncbi:MAG: DNA alkylation repair protein [Acidimicrobiaceae bacterium]|nr:DNA alkylation repair protein [Acidimicrobiaceae bacterium]